MAYYTAGIIGPYIRDAVTPDLFDISRGNIRTTGSLSVGTFASSNLVTPGYIRNDLAGSLLDISGGNITVAGTITAGSMSAPTTTYDNMAVAGWFRNNLTPTTLDMSGGNISNSGTTRSSNFIGTTASASNQIGGVTLSNTNITLAGTITGSTANTSNSIGGVTLSNTNITLAGTITGSTANTSNSIGGVTLSNTDITLAGTITGSTANTSNSIGGVVLSNTDITLAGTITGSTANTSNRIGGVTLSNMDICMSATGRILAPVLRSALSSFTYDISGGNISNSATHISSNFIGTAGASNQIGGVTLSNADISMSSTGRIVAPILRNAPTPSTYDISGGNISNSATHISSNFIGTAGASNQIGGVTLSNGNISNATGSSNQIAGVLLSNGTISNGISSSNVIGGITLSNATLDANRIHAATYIRNALVPSTFDISGGNISNSATTRSSNFIGTVAASNQIGGVTLSNMDICMSTPGRILAPILRNALTPSTYDISGGNISNSGRIFNGSGTVSAPSYTFGSDISTGLYDAGTNILGFTTAGVERMRVLANGRVCIATTDASTVFQVNPKVGDDNQYAYDSSAMMVVQPRPTSSTVLNDPTAVMYLARQGTGAQAFGAMASFKLSRFENNDTNSRTRLDLDLTHSTFNDVRVMTMRSDGRVGIGTTVPGHLLDVSSTGSAQIAGVVLTGGGIDASTGTAAAPSYSFLDDTDTGMFNLAPNTIGFAVGGTQRVQIDPSGNVGINTVLYGTGGTSDSSLNGTLHIRPRPITGVETPAVLTLQNTSTQFQRGQTQIRGVHAGATGAGSDLTFSTRLDSGANFVPSDLIFERMRIRHDGNVGIGTTRPEFLLDVSSSSSAGTGIFRNSSGNQAAIWVTSGTGAVYSTGLEMYHQSNSTQGLYATNTTPFTVWTGGTRRLTILGTGEVGIGTTSPGTNYGLDVATGVASSAAINMNTWPRVPVGNTYVAKGVAAHSTGSPSNAVRFSNALQEINAELAVVSNDTTHGTYFVIKKSGIWSIQAGPFLHSGGGGGTSALDVSTGFTGGTLPALGPTALDQVQTASGITKALTYTGFLPANTGLYYKVYQNNPQLTTNSNTARFVLSFIAETSGGPANYPI